ncbi:maleate cis-trans isomerase family protein [Aquisalibacillus elongatus]|uniref:Maleate cis-trans isomerase n=1 Tax=Aquisalibacillus elongatus TaxID=485577 RepID=A0A3N5B9A8_9BACI|nr:maleate cis-trans isomerase [Aquisalibacillus elongatus]RPF53947.1 maleate cis-trans isomerase [Aquisalibacillus elongatus]
MTHVGFLYPGFAAEDDYPLLGKMVDPPVDVTLIHTTFKKDAHTVRALTEMGSIPRLIEGAQWLKGKDIDSVLWTSTSASFTLGIEGVQEQITALENFLRVPASTTAMAFIHVADELNLDRVAVVATYPDDIALLFKAFLEEHGIKVVKFSSEGIMTAAEVGTLEREKVIQWVVKHDVDGADALLVPDTALHSVAWVEEMEERVQKPVLTANQVSFWEALRLAGKLTPQEGLGMLFKGGHSGVD